MERRRSFSTIITKDVAPPAAGYQHGVLVVAGSNPVVPTHRIAKLNTNKGLVILIRFMYQVCIEYRPTVNKNIRIIFTVR
jgi:hypothetical protein